MPMIVEDFEEIAKRYKEILGQRTVGNQPTEDDDEDDDCIADLGYADFF